MPFDEGENAGTVAKGINTRVGIEGDITAKIKIVRVSISTDKTWAIER